MANEEVAAAPVTLMIGMVTPGTMMTATCKCLIDLTQDLQAHGLPFAFSTHRGTDMVAIRNGMMSEFLTRRQFTHALLIDSDMIFKPEDFWRLLAHGEDFVVASYPQKYYDWTDLQRRVDEEAQKPPESRASIDVLLSRSFDYNQQLVGFDGRPWRPAMRDGFITVPAVGPGFALLTRAVPETMVARGVAIRYPRMGQLPGYKGLDWHDFFSHRATPDGGLMHAVDQSFCHRWVESCGGDIWLDVDAVLPHIGSHQFVGRYRDRLPEDFPNLAPPSESAQAEPSPRGATAVPDVSETATDGPKSADPATERMPLRWLFLATLPGSGSTLLADLLRLCCGAEALESRAEGQWLIPELSAPGRRWVPDWPDSLDVVRDIWREVARRRGLAGVIVEKSPPSLCRMPRLLTSFADEEHSLIRLVRDPFAVCASWSRYPVERVADWMPGIEHVARDEGRYFTLMAELYGRRMTTLAALDEESLLTVRYEDLAADPLATLARIVAVCPGLSQPGDTAPVGVENRNARSVGTLAPEQRDAISVGLAPYAKVLERFGYSPDAPLSSTSMTS